MVSRRPFTGETRVQSRESAVEFYGGKIGSGTRFSPIMLFSFVSIVPPGLSTYLHDAYWKQPGNHRIKQLYSGNRELCNKNKLHSFFHKF